MPAAKRGGSEGRGLLQGRAWLLALPPVTAWSTWKHLTQGTAREGKENYGRLEKPGLRATPRPGAEGSWQRFCLQAPLKVLHDPPKGQVPKGLSSFRGLKGRHRAIILSFAPLAPGLPRTPQAEGSWHHVRPGAFSKSPAHTLGNAAFFALRQEWQKIFLGCSLFLQNI